MKRIMTVAMLLAVLLASGCGDEGTEPPIPTEGTIFEYSRAGGIAFSVYEVTIDADGTGVARFGSDLENLDESEFTLSRDEVDELRSILEDSPLASLPEPGHGVCSDCFEYTYAYGGDMYTLDDASDSVPELDDLGAFLSELPLPEDRPNGG